MLVAAVPQERAFHPGVVIGGVHILGALFAALVVTFDAVAATGTAARAEQPEKSGGPGARHGNPGDDEHIMAKRTVDIIILQSVVESSRECRVKDGDGQGKGDDKDAADSRDDGRDQATPPAQEREEADHYFHRGRDDRYNVRYQHPFGDRLVDLQSVPKLFAKQLVRFGPGESPYLHRIEPVV